MLKTLGSEDYSDIGYWDGVAEEMKGKSGTIERPRAASSSPQRIALIALQNGPLAAYINYFIRTCGPNGPDVHFFIFHTEDE